MYYSYTLLSAYFCKSLVLTADFGFGNALISACHHFFFNFYIRCLGFRKFTGYKFDEGIENMDLA